MEIAESWAQIERWLAANAPDIVPMLPPGATPAALAQAEETLGYALPPEIKDFLTVHDGSAHVVLHDWGEFMSLDGIISAWDMLVDLWDDGNNDEWANPEGPIRKKWFTRYWLPVLSPFNGDHLCVDLDPPMSGKPGQIITWHHDNGPTEILASNFSDLLAGYLADLAGGSYIPRINRAGGPYLDYTLDRT